MFKRAARSLRRLLSGIELARFDSTSGHGATRISLRLKATRDERYVMLALRAPGHSHFTDLSLDEFHQLASSIEGIKAALLGKS